MAWNFAKEFIHACRIKYGKDVKVAVDETNKKIVVEAGMKFVGTDATDSNISKFIEFVEDGWGGKIGGYEVKTTITIYKEGDFGYDNACIVYMSSRPEHVQSGTSQRTNTIYFNTSQLYDSYAACHEFGHLIGCFEHYHSTSDGPKSEVAYIDNVMGAHVKGEPVTYSSSNLSEVIDYGFTVIKQ